MFEGASGCSVSVVVAGKDKTAALVTLHREFQLGEIIWPCFLPPVPQWQLPHLITNLSPPPLRGIERSHVVRSRPVI